MELNNIKTQDDENNNDSGWLLVDASKPCDRKRTPDIKKVVQLSNIAADSLEGIKPYGVCVAQYESESNESVESEDSWNLRREDDGSVESVTNDAPGVYEDAITDLIETPPGTLAHNEITAQVNVALPDNLWLSRGQYSSDVTQPDEVVTQPDEVVTQPDEVVTQPDEVVNQPDEVVTQPDEVVTQPDEVVNQPDEVVTEPDEVVTQPNEVVTQQDEVVTQPDLVVTQPDEVVTQPDEVVIEPVEVVTQPNEVVTHQDEVVTQPDLVVTQPDDPDDVVTQPDEVVTQHKPEASGGYDDVDESPEPLKTFLLPFCNVTNQGPPEIRRLPTKVVFDDPGSFIRTCVIGLDDDKMSYAGIGRKVILAVGATGAGKTTLVNGMINYALGVEYEDPFRFEIELDNDEVKKTRSQAESQTTWVTAYTLYPGEGSKVKQVLTIVDTPGFGDTGGLAKDEQLLKKLRSLFGSTECEVDCLHGICFVVQSSLARLTPSQKYIFDGVLSVFGKDVADNISMLLTFCDAETPPVLEAIKAAKITFKNYFRFNNSALFAKNSNDETQDIFNKMFWSLGSKSFDEFFTYLTQEARPVSLLLTKTVLDKREQVEIVIAGLQYNIKRGLSTLDSLKNEMKVVEQHKVSINENKDFRYKRVEDFADKIQKKAGTHVTNCLTCTGMTCHQNCSRSNDEDKKRCWAMDTDGNCRICPGRCAWNVHHNQEYYFVWKQRTVSVTVSEMEAKYKIAENEKNKAETLIEKMGEEFDGIQGEVLIQTNEVRQLLEILQNIALKPNPMTNTDYIDQMIRAEEWSHETGWKRRVEQLILAKERAIQLEKLADSGFDPFEDAKSKAAKESEKLGYAGTIMEQSRQLFKLLITKLS